MAEVAQNINVVIDDVLKLTEDKLGDLRDGQFLIPQEDIEKNIDSVGLSGQGRDWVNNLMGLSKSSRTNQETVEVFIDNFYLHDESFSNYKSELGLQISSRVGDTQIGVTDVEFEIIKRGTVNVDLSQLNSRTEIKDEATSLNGEVQRVISEWNSVPLGDRKKIIKVFLGEFWNPAS